MHSYFCAINIKKSNAITEIKFGTQMVLGSVDKCVEVTSTMGILVKIFVLVWLLTDLRGVRGVHFKFYNAFFFRWFGTKRPTVGIAEFRIANIKLQK